MILLLQILGFTLAASFALALWLVLIVSFVRALRFTKSTFTLKFAFMAWMAFLTALTVWQPFAYGWVS